MGKYDGFQKSAFKRIPPKKIAAWIEQNFEYRIRKGGEEYQICDPFDYDTRFRFQINPSKGVCNSWHGNEWAGPVNPKTGKRNCSFIKFVRVYRKCSYKDALSEVLGATEDLSSYMKPEGRLAAPEVKKTVLVALPDGAEILATSADPQAAPLIKWLGTRGYSFEDIERVELHHFGMDVYWPYYEFDTLVYWQARSRLNKRFEFPDQYVYDDDGNIVGETEGTKGDFFYGFDDVEPASFLIIVEAIFDQHTLGEQVLASGGADLTNNQLKKLKLLGPRKGVILSPDNDIAGIKSLVNNHQLLTARGFTTFYSLPPKLEYRVGDEVRITKDWNEILTGCKLSRQDIRTLHDEKIRKLTLQETIKLKKLLK